MADKKISQLTAATALAGTEVVPVVQGGTTKKATIDQILAPAAGKGIDFSANTGAAGMTSELLDWYEEGTWTPTDNSGAALALAVSYAKYTRIGRAVFINAFIEYPITADGSNTNIAGLPFAVDSSSYPPFTVNSNSGTALSAYADATTTTFKFTADTNYATIIVNSALSGKGVIISGCYFTP